MDYSRCAETAIPAPRPSGSLRLPTGTWGMPVAQERQSVLCKIAPVDFVEPRGLLRASCPSPFGSAYGRSNSFPTNLSLYPHSPP